MNPPYCWYRAPQRKLGDSNPRYGYPHGSLANCWFQPLTQTSLAVCTAAFSLKCGAKVSYIFVTCKFFRMFFLIFFLFRLFIAVVRGFATVCEWAAGTAELALAGIPPCEEDTPDSISQGCGNDERDDDILPDHGFGELRLKRKRPTLRHGVSSMMKTSR